MNADDLSHLSLLELFRVEVENQTTALTTGLLELERQPEVRSQTSEARPPASGLRPLTSVLESLMRAAHSLKGAARIVNQPSAVAVAHAMEDAFVAAQRGQVSLGQPHIDLLLRGVDLLVQISKCSEATRGTGEPEPAGGIQQFLLEAAAILPGKATNTASEITTESLVSSPWSVAAADERPTPPGAPAATDDGLRTVDCGLRTTDSERVVRLNADNLNRLLDLAGESLVESRWLRPFSDSMQRLKRMQSELEQALDGLRLSLEAPPVLRGRTAEGGQLTPQSATHLAELFQRIAETRQFLSERLQELDHYDRRGARLSNRLYHEVLRTRMRPFDEGTRRFPRMVRDLARALGKQARLEIIGEQTRVDREILERLEAPLTHLLRNAVDHGCETPALRVAAGKPPEAVIQLEARHSAGLLLVSVSDDGAGVDAKCLRQVIVEKGLTTAPLAEKMGEAELLEFLFLPGFTMKDQVSEISGRGVGLDVVRTMVQGVRGTIRMTTQPGRGTRFQLQLPLTLSVLRALLVEVGGEPYAIPLAQITRTLKLPPELIETFAGRPHFTLDKQRAGLVSARAAFGCEPPMSDPSGLSDQSVVVLGDPERRYGLVVDRFLGERELAVRPLDPRLGNVKDISAAALLENGAPVLIVDVEDLLRSVDKLAASGSLPEVPGMGGELPAKKTKRILAVDDSPTVRELERQLLTGQGYLADVAADGMDAWNAVRTGGYDLVITDVDLPRLDGIELTALIKQDARCKSLPVIIVSYLDRPEDRRCGLAAGADYYLTKGNFQDEALLQAVLDLIGEPEG